MPKNQHHTTLMLTIACSEDNKKKTPANELEYFPPRVTPPKITRLLPTAAAGTQCTCFTGT